MPKSFGNFEKISHQFCYAFSIKNIGSENFKPFVNELVTLVSLIMVKSLFVELIVRSAKAALVAFVVEKN